MRRKRFGWENQGLCREGGGTALKQLASTQMTDIETSSEQAKAG